MDGNGCDYVELLPENLEVWNLYAQVCNQVIVAADGTVLGLNLGTVSQVMELLDVPRAKRGEYLESLTRIHDLVCPPLKEKKKESPKAPNAQRK